MSAVNNNWYDLNSARPYPLDDGATLTSDAGEALPTNLLVDAHLKFPNTAGSYCFVTAMTVTPNLATITFAASDTLDDDATITPLGVLGILNPVPWKQYAVSSQYPGFGGYIALGTAISGAAFSHRCSKALQSRLMVGSAASYVPMPVRSISTGAAGAKLTGVITLKGGNDIEIVKECREIPVTMIGATCDHMSSIAREVIVIRLVNTQAQTTADRNVLATYAGPCSGRPESNSCGDPQPIQSINGITPDCCGAITISLNGCAVPATTQLTNTVMIDCNTGLSDVCPSGNLPSPDGTLPGLPDGNCADSIIDIDLCS